MNLAIKKVVEETIWKKRDELLADFGGMVEFTSPDSEPGAPR